MKFATQLLFGAALALIPAAAIAADLPSRKAPVAAPVSAATWTGFYLGATTGYNFWTDPGIYPKLNGALVGLRAGYDHQINQNLVLGVVVDGDLNFASRSYRYIYDGATYDVTVKHRYTLSADLKAGYAFDAMNMAYVLGGYTHGKLKGKVSSGSSSVSDFTTANGWNVGLGFERRFTENVSGFTEYRFNRINKNGGHGDISQLKAGVAYRF